MGGGTHGSRPTTKHFVGQGPCALPGGAGEGIPQSRLCREALGREMWIATASVRTGFAMTGFLQAVRYKAGRVVREADPYGSVFCGA